MMRIFEPKKGLKPIFTLYKFLSLVLIPTFIILIFLKTSLKGWIGILSFSYLFVGILMYISQKTIKYWIADDTFFYRSFPFSKGSIPIQEIRKIILNSDNWLSQMPASSKTGGVSIYYNKYDEVYISPENNEEFAKVLLEINPDIEVVK